MLDLGLQGVKVLVTGASGGIGLETARVFLSQGANVVAHYNSTSSALDPLLRDSTECVALQADLTSEVDVVKLFDEHESKFGIATPIQILVVNHGIWPNHDAPLARMSLDQWNTTLTTNLTSSFLAVREFLRRIDRPDVSLEYRQKVAVVLVGSTAGKYGEHGHADYAASKSAMMYGLLLSLKNEIVKIAPRGRANCVAPGWVDTPMATEALKDPEIVYRALASYVGSHRSPLVSTPLRKVATSKDVAQQILLLASSICSGHVTGQVIMVEGGMEGRLLNDREDITGPGV